MRTLTALMALALLTGCNPTYPNRAAVFTPTTGAISVKLRIPGQANTRAEFTLNGRALTADTDASDGYSVVIDTVEFPNGLLTLKARILDQNNQLVRELEHSMLIQNASPAP